MLEDKVLKLIEDSQYFKKYKTELHEISCKMVNLYDYCIILADRKYYDLLLDRFNKIRGPKNINFAITFMDDRGVVLYEDGMNKKLLEILAKKTKRNKELHRKVKNLMELIS